MVGAVFASAFRPKAADARVGNWFTRRRGGAESSVYLHRLDVSCERLMLPLGQNLCQPILNARYQFSPNGKDQSNGGDQEVQKAESHR